MGSLFSRYSAPPGEPKTRDRAASEVAALPGIDDAVEGAQPAPLSRVLARRVDAIDGGGAERPEAAVESSSDGCCELGLELAGGTTPARVAEAGGIEAPGRHARGVEREDLNGLTGEEAFGGRPWRLPLALPRTLEGLGWRPML